MRRMLVLLLAVVSLAGCASYNDLDRAIAGYIGGNLMFDTDKVEGSLNPAAQFGLNGIATGERLGLWFDIGMFYPMSFPYTGGSLGTEELGRMFGINMKAGPSIRILDDYKCILSVTPYFNFMFANAANTIKYAMLNVTSSRDVISLGAGVGLTMYHTFGEMFSVMAGIDLGLDFYQNTYASINDRELWEVSGNEIMLVVAPKLGLGMRL